MSPRCCRADQSSYGFDNVTVGDLSPTLLDRYVSAAEKISRLAVGRPGRSPGGDTSRIRPDLTQEEHFDGFPVGTRGGALVPYTFPQDGEYEIQIRLARDRNEHVEGLSEPHELELLLDRERVQLFTVKPAPLRKEHSLDYQPSQENLDDHLKIRLPVKAGPHTLGVTFLKKPSALLETERQPYQAHFNYYRHPRIQPAIYSISIIGPYAVKGPGDTPSRRRILVCRPASPGEEEGCAKRILATLMRRAYRRPVTDADLQRPFELYREARAEGGFEAGIEMALAAVLVKSPLPVPHRTRPCRPRAEYGLSHQRSGACVPPVLFPVEQYSGRRAARCGHSGEAQEARGPRTTGAANAGGLSFAEPGDQLCLAVAAFAQSGIDDSGHAYISGLR